MPFPNLNGRPVEYTEDVPNKVGEYVNSCFENKELPTKAGLAVYIGICKQTLLTWAKKSEQLLDALKKMDSLQENECWQKALKGEYNPTIAKLLLANHGYYDKVQNDNTNTNLNTDIKDEENGKTAEEKLQDVLKRIKELKKE
jgi:hypothetical protein